MAEDPYDYDVGTLVTMIGFPSHFMISYDRLVSTEYDTYVTYNLQN